MRGRRLLAGLMIAGTGVAIAGSAGLAATRIFRVPPAITANLPGGAIKVSLDAASATAIPVPPQGSLTIAEARGQALMDVSGDQVRAIGSVAKTLTALVVLRHHPLIPDQPGPTVTMTAADVQLYNDSIAQDGSSVPVVAGERLTEWQLLLGLMLPSANNLAETLARWIGGDRSSFVRELNSVAAELGMTHSHFDDPSGFSPKTVSTGNDLLKLGQAALDEPTLAKVVGTQHAVLSDGTALDNLNALLGIGPGWLGIKTGETAAAGACLLFAARGTPPGSDHGVTLVGAVLGQAHLQDALHQARIAVEAALAGYRSVDLTNYLPSNLGVLSMSWGGDVPLAAQPVDGNMRLTARAGDLLGLQFRVGGLHGSAVAADAGVAFLDISRNAQVVRHWILHPAHAVPGPSAWWLLTH